MGQNTLLLNVAASDAVIIADVVSSGRATQRKVKKPLTLRHQPLLSQLARPSFNPSNACLAPKKDAAHNICLLSCMKAYEHLTQRKSHRSLELFRGLVLAEIAAAQFVSGAESEGASGTKPPVSHQVMYDSLITRFYADAFDNVSGSGITHSPSSVATVSVLGALAAQEVIKSITHIHTPVSQFQLFESLDSSPFSSEVVAELAGLRVFVVGAGAIGCELLKNFALMNISTADGLTGIDVNQTGHVNSGSDGTCDGNIKSSGAWSELQRGGVVVTDMDHIERSNLNRQLLFR